MRLLILGLAVLALPLAVPESAIAQQPQPTPVVSGTYYRCDASREQRASEIIRTVAAPVFQKYMDAGAISAWGLLAHKTGGPWRRAVYFVGQNLGRLMAAQDSILAELRRGHAKEMTEFSSICPDHDDYLWTYVTASQPATQIATVRPAAAFSTYYICHEATEALSDEAMTSVFAPIYNKQVKAGRLNSWAWFSHFVGGKYRRLLAMDGPSFGAILEARDSIIADTQAQYPQIGAAMSQVCDGHTDYLWNIEMAKP